MPHPHDSGGGTQPLNNPLGLSPQLQRLNATFADFRNRGILSNPWVSPVDRFNHVLAQEQQAHEIELELLRQAGQPNRTPGAGTRARVAGASARFGLGGGRRGNRAVTTPDNAHINPDGQAAAENAPVGISDPNPRLLDFGSDERDGVFGPLKTNRPPQFGRASQALRKSNVPGGF